MTDVFAFLRGRRRRIQTELIEGTPNVITSRSLSKIAKTSEVIVDPAALAKCIAHASRYPHNEVAGLMLGRADGRFLIVEDLVPAQRIGTATAVDLPGREFDRALSAAKKGQYTVGWFHSHPNLGVFMSSTDVTHQAQGEGLYPDFVGLVMDPFRPSGIDFAFFRLKAGKFVQLPHHYFFPDVDA